MAAIHSLLLLLTAIAPFVEPYTISPFWNDTSALDSEEEVLSPCAPFLRPEGERECPPNEHYERCGDVCIQSCVHYECPLRCCVEGCFCDEGHVRGSDGTCIREEKCTRIRLFHETNRIDEPEFDSPKECGPDEYISCDSHCQRNCSNYHDVIFCDKMCVLDCVCIPPKIRGPLGNCILPHQCTALTVQVDEALEQRRCRPGEFLTCKSRCERTCDNWREVETECPDECHTGCVCLPPKVRGPNGVCVHPEECPSSREKMLEEHMKMAAMICNFVRIMGNPPAWSDSCPMIVHECTDPSECFEENSSPPLLGQFSICRKNEFLNVLPSCPVTCDNYRNKTKECKVTDKIVPRCDCKQGLVRDSDGNCIPPLNCPNENESEKCSENEEWKTCGSACPKTCENYDIEVPCIAICAVGCFCSEPMVRGPDGRCIFKEECPLQSAKSEKCPENEEWKTCGSACPKTCQNYDVEVPCIAVCAEGCFCREPMVRGPDGRCVFKEECHLQSAFSGQFSICRRNEFLNVLPSCPVTCDNYRNKTKECKVADMIVPRCDCKQGLVRDSDGNCIPPLNCPNEDRDSKKCPENEEWQTCGSACPKTCQNYDVEVPCIAVCAEGCFCREPRVRGPDGRCVFKEECHLQSAYDPCPDTECAEGWYLDYYNTPCPICRRCPLIQCRPGCYYDSRHKPCPRCVCFYPQDGNTGTEN